MWATAQRSTLSDCKLGLTQTDANCLRSSHGIWIYHFIMTSDDCFLLFTQVRPVQRISYWRLSQESICNNISFLGLKWKGSERNDKLKKKIKQITDVECKYYISIEFFKKFFLYITVNISAVGYSGQVGIQSFTSFLSLPYQLRL